MAQTIRRRAKSAGQSHTVMEERMRKTLAKGGRGMTLQDAAGRVTLVHHALGNRPVEIIGADGEPTGDGKTWYRLQGVPPPTAFRYEQPLIQGDWVHNFKGKLVRVLDTVTGRPTTLGEKYFRYNRDE